jgi:hypothetical protein
MHALNRSTAFAAGLAVIVFCAACGSDPGLEVERMPDPLSSSAPSAASTDIIPLEDVRKSQAAAVSQRIANTEITITYSRPVARGRELFGGIVPLDVVWNPGADQATALAVTRDIEVNGQALTAGKYSLWMIPRTGPWSVIFSAAADVYHTPYPGEDQDVLRLDVSPVPVSHTEALTFSFPTVEGKDAELLMHWGGTGVPLAIRVP